MWRCRISLLSPITSRALTLRSPWIPTMRRTMSTVPVTSSGIASLIHAYRVYGHRKASLDPLGMAQKHLVRELDPEQYGLTNPEETFSTTGLMHFPNNQTEATLQQILSHLEHTYCRHIGVQTAHVTTAEERDFFAQALERVDVTTLFTPAEKRNIHSLLVQSEIFDRFMGVKFTAFKRYGLEGAEATMPAMESIFTTASSHGIEHIVIGMPHRGRLNFLVSLLDYPSRALFAKVKGLSHIPADMDGWDDVASHIAQSVTKKFDKKHNLSVSLLHNPSHLEAINPVALGKTRAKQDELGEHGPSRIMCVQLHGDAAFAGQGVVTETLMMANLPDFKTGGTVHIIVNNQIGFTTFPHKGRSTAYSADVVKLINAPILHVNGDDPESVVHACRIAMEYRHIFGRDVIIDLIGYRKHGHNEVDEPSFTQPLMYKNIRSRKSVVTLYAEQLTQQGLLAPDSATKLISKLNSHLEQELAAVATWKPNPKDHFQGKWSSMKQAEHVNEVVDTGVPATLLRDIGIASVTYPKHLTIHPRLERMHVEPRIKSCQQGTNLDWATCEAMAFGSLLHSGYNMRIAGQDVERGTFSQRHGVLVDQNTEERYTPLANAGYPGQVYNVNSHLSEFAVLGFEYGYNWDSPNTLNIWEAQFGDFNNGAQIIIDTFITSGESKWLRASGLVMLLPHGYDGAGPEHSSCRMERFLQLVDSEPENMKPVALNFLFANPSTPAQYFHLIRRQMLRSYRKPLIVASPKTLLRHAQAISTLADMAPGTHFQPVLPDALAPEKVTHLVFCSGKVYYDLENKRNLAKRTDIAFIRIEELAPFPYQQIQQHLARYAKDNIRHVTWFQEEPNNAGAWWYVEPRFRATLREAGWKQEMGYVGRPALPSPAVGSTVAHKAQESAIYNAIFTK